MPKRSGIIHGSDTILHNLRAGRDAAISVRRQARIGSDPYNRAGALLDAIDALAEELTGDATFLHSKGHGVG